jgi:methionyl-tRNA formyltransferase
MRVVLVSQVLPAVKGFDQLLRGLGHHPVALLCSREHQGRYGGEFDRLVREAPAELDIVIPAAPEAIAPLVRPYEPDLLLCLGFPWKIPAEALAVPRLGAVNTHPSLLPAYRGPNPVAWMIRNGEEAIGFTLHRMDGELDTGPILAQAPIPLDDEHSWEELEPKLASVIGELLPRALARVEAGDPGDPQGEGTYYPFFEPEYMLIDWSKPSAEIRRQVRAWRFASRRDGFEHGALAEFDGEEVRVLRVSEDAGHGRAVESGDGKLWILETEPR